jgi:hypothetical protein
MTETYMQPQVGKYPVSPKLSEKQRPIKLRLADFRKHEFHCKHEEISPSVQTY